MPLTLHMSSVEAVPVQHACSSKDRRQIAVGLLPLTLIMLLAHARPPSCARAREITYAHARTYGRRDLQDHVTFSATNFTEGKQIVEFLRHPVPMQNCSAQLIYCCHLHRTLE